MWRYAGQTGFLRHQVKTEAEPTTPYGVVSQTWWLKARIVEREETCIARLQQPKQPAIAKQRLCKYVLAAKNTSATMEELLENRQTTIEKPCRQRFLCGPRRRYIRRPTDNVWRLESKLCPICRRHPLGKSKTPRHTDISKFIEIEKGLWTRWYYKRMPHAPSKKTTVTSDTFTCV
jgi:hypothetical protein